MHTAYTNVRLRQREKEIADVINEMSVRVWKRQKPFESISRPARIHEAQGEEWSEMEMGIKLGTKQEQQQQQQWQFNKRPNLSISIHVRRKTVNLSSYCSLFAFVCVFGWRWRDASYRWNAWISFIRSLSLHSFRFSAHLRAFTFIPFVYGIYFCLPLVFVRFVCVLSSHFISFSNGYCLLPKARKIIPVYSMTIIRSLLRFSHSNIRVLLLFVMGPSIVYVCLCVCVYTMENVFHSPALAPM